MEIISRKEATQKGLKKFFTGKPCKHGHINCRSLPSGSCCQCIRDFGKKWYKVKRDHKLEKSKENYRKNRENVLARTDKYRRENLDKYRLWSKAWAKKNPGKAYAFARKWTKAHPEKIITYNRNQQARRKKAEGKHYPSDIEDRIKWQRGCCAACGIKLSNKYHVDHYIPLAKGGHNNPSNLQILCSMCNGRKHAKDPIVFYQEMGFLL